jgi:hypothetical protein
MAQAKAVFLVGFFEVINCFNNNKNENCNVKFKKT